MEVIASPVVELDSVKTAEDAEQPGGQQEEEGIVKEEIDMETREDTAPIEANDRKKHDEGLSDAQHGSQAMVDAPIGSEATVDEARKDAQIESPVAVVDADEIIIGGNDEQSTPGEGPSGGDAADGSEKELTTVGESSWTTMFDFQPTTAPEDGVPGPETGGAGLAGRMCW